MEAPEYSLQHARMMDSEASSKFPNSHIIMRMDNMESDMGTVLYVGDDKKEIFALFDELADKSFCGIIEGVNLRNSLGVME